MNGKIKRIAVEKLDLKLNKEIYSKEDKYVEETINFLVNYREIGQNDYNLVNYS